MQLIRENLYLVDGTEASHVYLLQLPNHTVLIDTCIPGKADTILEECATLGIAPEQITDIILTHHDVDHLGNAAALRERCGAKLWVSPLDAPYVRRERRWLGIRRAMEVTIPWKVPEVDALLTPGETLFGAVEVLATPGHTPGHISLLWEDVLIAGDLVGTIRSKKPEDTVSLLPNFLTWNRAVLERSVRQVGKRDFTWVCPGHGVPARREDRWEALVAGFRK
ncbi:MAG: MBL fold metallo-hydrolase [Catalinimonas sp.]